MKTKNLQLKALLASLFLSVVVSNVHAGTITYDASAGDTIKTNTHWVSNNVYLLKGNIYVINGAVLTIDPGTFIKGDFNSKGALIISAGSQIQAVGTPCKPIVFSSAKAAGLRQRGDWGGVIVLGKAGHNLPITFAGATSTGANIEGIVANKYTLFGPIAGAVQANATGNVGDTYRDDHDNSGTLKYVRIEFAGVALSPNNEINGLTFGAVGDGTTVDYIQVSYANDDSYEWFGGTVNCKHLIAFRGIDDDFDTDNGFSGHIQFGVGLRDPDVADVSQSGGFESDNDATGTTNLPQTRVTFTNMTILAGSDSATNALFKGDAHIRRNSHLNVVNSIFGGYPKGFEPDGQLTHNNIIADTMIQNNILQCTYAPKYVVSEGGATNGAAVIDLLLNHANNQFFATNAAGANLTDPYNLDAPNFQPHAGSPALTSPVYSFSTPLLSDPFFTPVSYLGAFDGTNDWTATWSEFDPVNVVYGSKGIDYTPKIGAAVINPVVCPNSGSISISVTKGLSPYSYAWSNGKTTKNLTKLSEGSYTVIVYPKGGEPACSATKHYTVGYLAPQFTSGDVTSTTINVNFDNSNIATYQSGFLTEVRYKRNSVDSPWSAWGGATSATNLTWQATKRNVVTQTNDTIKGLVPNKAYKFMVRGVCQISGSNFAFTDSAHSALAVYKTAASFAADAIVSSKAEDKSSSINVYPNPANGSFKVDIAGFTTNNVTLKLTNLNGQVVYTAKQSITGKSTIATVNTGNLTPGVYNVEISDGNKTVTKKVTIVQ